MIEQIQQNAEFVQSVARDQLNVDVGFDREAVEWLDGYVTRQHEQGDPKNFEGLVNTLGSFLGECIVRTYGGEWSQGDHGWCVQFDEENAAYPFAKIEKHLVNGPEDSVLSMFDAIPLVFEGIAASPENSTISGPYDRVATASDAVKLTFSKANFQKLYPQYFRWFGRKETIDGQAIELWYERFAEHLEYGDSRAAVVVSKKPLLVAAYTDELDCVALLKFPARRGITAQLSVGERLLTVNTYNNYAKVVSDLQPGPDNSGLWENFDPMIADFFSSDLARIAARKKEIDDYEWTRAQQQGEKYLLEMPNHIRDGCPFYSMIPGTPEHLLKKLNERASAPNFAVTPVAVDRFCEILSDMQVTCDDVAVLMDITSVHPEVYERQMGVQPLQDLQGDQHFHIQMGDCKFAIPKKSAHAYDDVVLGYDEVRGGFIFHNQ